MVPSGGALATPTYPAERDAVLLEDDGRDEGHLVPQESITALGAPGEEPWSRKDGHQLGGRQLSRPTVGSVRLPSGAEHGAVWPPRNKAHRSLPKAVRSAGGSDGSPQASGE